MVFRAGIIPAHGDFEGGNQLGFLPTVAEHNGSFCLQYHTGNENCAHQQPRSTKIIVILRRPLAFNSSSLKEPEALL